MTNVIELKLLTNIIKFHYREGDSTLENVVKDIADIHKANNPDFDADHFIQDCNMEIY